jgi:hypothetical protein|nr:MAG TPA: hypothetical protein [Caudoviricetes sp.]DAM40463.1 MAG TPA: hypothetical protein [Caudoviricetes sp.]
MLTCTNNVFSIRKDRFKENGAKFSEVKIEKIDISNSFNSFDLEEENFLNYANSENQEIYKTIENLYLKIKNGEDIFRDYIADELYPRKDVIDRLINIINYSNNPKYQNKDIISICKFKNKNNRKIHLYTFLTEGKLKILLIDLHHLSIPGDIYSKGQLIKRVDLKDMNKLYEKVKNHKYDLNNITKKIV